MFEKNYTTVVTKMNPVGAIKAKLLANYGSSDTARQTSCHRYQIRNTLNTVGIYFNLPGVNNPHFICSKKIGAPFHLTAEVVDEGQTVLRKFTCPVKYDREHGVSVGPIELAFAPRAFDKVAWNARGREYNLYATNLNRATKDIEFILNDFISEQGIKEALSRMLDTKYQGSYVSDSNNPLIIDTLESQSTSKGCSDSYSV